MVEVSSGPVQALGNYHIIAEIGSGSSGRVYQGKHIILTERVAAIKLLHSHLRTPEEYARFVEEARILERLKHPHILHIFDVGIHEGFPYLVAEYAPHGSLRNHLRKYLPNPMPVEEALTILTQVGRGLYYAHRHNIIHRDLKPENILFNVRGQALLADFGLATTLSTESILHATVIGTPSYMAPEQFQGSVSKESDQYALGCIAYELFTGRAPFTASNHFTMGINHLVKDPIAPTQLNPQLPPHIERAILKAMAKQRADRYADIKAFILALYTPGDTDPQLALPTLSSISLFTETDNSNLSASPTSITPLPLLQEPVTPLPPSVSISIYDPWKQTANQFPIGSSPSVYTSSEESRGQADFAEATLPRQGNIVESLPTISGSVKQQEDAISGTYATELIKTPLSSQDSTTNRTDLGKSHVLKRQWLLMAVVCLLVIASLFSFALSRSSSSHNKTLVADTLAHVPTHRSAHSPLYNPTPTHAPIATHVLTAIPTPTPTHSPCHPSPHCHPRSRCRPCH